VVVRVKQLQFEQPCWRRQNTTVTDPQGTWQWTGWSDKLYSSAAVAETMLPDEDRVSISGYQASS